jgi:hypothetical protein
MIVSNGGTHVDYYVCNHSIRTFFSTFFFFTNRETHIVSFQVKTNSIQKLQMHTIIISIRAHE